MGSVQRVQFCLKPLPSDYLLIFLTAYEVLILSFTRKLRLKDVKGIISSLSATQAENQGSNSALSLSIMGSWGHLSSEKPQPSLRVSLDLP